MQLKISYFGIFYDKEMLHYPKSSVLQEKGLPWLFTIENLGTGRVMYVVNSV